MKNWLRRNTLYFVFHGIILAIFLVGFGAGYICAPEKTEQIVVEECTTTTTITGSTTERGTTTTTPCATTTRSNVCGSNVEIPLDNDLQWYIRVKSAEYGVPLALVYAVIETESGFDANAVSETGDYGLMQINELYHDYYEDVLNIDDCIDPYNNVLTGIYILSCYIDEYGDDLDAVLMCYNGGKGYLALMWNKGVYSTDYTDRVLARFNAYGGYEYV